MFDEILQQLTEQTPGGIGAVLMGYDGIAIATHVVTGSDLDLAMIAIEYANLLKEIRKAADVLNNGDMEEVDIRTSRCVFAMRTVTDEYFVALAIARDGNFGKGRYLLRRDSGRLQQALL